MEINKNIIADLRVHYGEAFYLLDSAQFRKNFLELKEAFNKIYPNWNIAYSYKTNYTPKLCKIVNELGGYAEVVSEMELEIAKRVGCKAERIIWHGPIKNVAIMEQFLLELGRGFAFMGRQYVIPIGSRRFKVDLVFYNAILKCYVLIDLKRAEIKHGDIGQMNLYLNYFKNEICQPDDNPPIGIVLGAKKDELLMEYALQGIDNQLFAARYQLYLPNREELQAQLDLLLDNTKEKK